MKKIAKTENNKAYMIKYGNKEVLFKKEGEQIRIISILEYL